MNNKLSYIQILKFASEFRKMLNMHLQAYLDTDDYLSFELQPIFKKNDIACFQLFYVRPDYVKYVVAKFRFSDDYIDFTLEPVDMDDGEWQRVGNSEGEADRVMRDVTRHAAVWAAEEIHGGDNDDIEESCKPSVGKAIKLLRENGYEVKLNRALCEDSPYDMTDLVSFAYQRGNRSIADTSAKLAPLRAEKGKYMNKLLANKLSAYFKDTEFTLSSAIIGCDTIHLRLSGPKIDNSFFNVACILRVPSFTVKQNKELWRNQICTNYGGKYKEIQLDSKSLDTLKRFTSKTPKEIQVWYFKLIKTLRGLRKFASLIENDANIQDINDELSHVLRNGTTVHPLLASPGIT